MMTFGCGCRATRRDIKGKYEEQKERPRLIGCPGMNNNCAYVLTDQELIVCLGPAEYKAYIEKCKVLFSSLTTHRSIKANSARDAVCQTIYVSCT